MTDDEIFAKAVVDVFNKRGENGAATYTPVTGATPFSTTAIVGNDLDLEPDGGAQGTFMSMDDLVAVVPKLDFTNNSYNPRKGDIITITATSTVYKVQGKLESDGYYMVLSIIE